MATFMDRVSSYRIQKLSTITELKRKHQRRSMPYYSLYGTKTRKERKKFKNFDDYTLLVYVESN